MRSTVRRPAAAAPRIEAIRPGVWIDTRPGCRASWRPSRCSSGDAMTGLLYFTDSYLRAFEATVVAADGDRLALDRTAFYPTGGGQPHDLGWIEAAGGRRVAVTEVRRDGERVWHAAPGHGLGDGERIRGEIDWERRYALMRTHTALHVLSAVIWRDHRVPVTGSGMEPLRGRMDFELAE